jgi:hypothetical protein
MMHFEVKYFNAQRKSSSPLKNERLIFLALSPGERAG